jgi:hypothetical protein
VQPFCPERSTLSVCGILRGMKSAAFLMALLACTAAAQTNPAAMAARQWRQQHERAIVDEFITLLSIPNIASDRDNITRNAEAIRSMLEKRGVPSQLVAIPGANPVVVGDLKTSGATRTIVLYAHYDGQSLDPKEWTSPPFQPVLRSGLIEKDGQVIPLPAADKPFDPEWRLYARSARDDKAPIIAMLSAIDAIRVACACAPTSSSCSKARRRRARPTWKRSLPRTRICLQAMCG